MHPQPKYNETDLVIGLKARDQQVFTYLYDQYSGAIMGVIFRLLNDQQLAEDVLQEAFVKFWNNIQQYDAGKGRLFTWMINIARNLAIDTLRSKGFKKQQQISKDENSVVNYHDPHQHSEKFDKIGLQKQVSQLKPEYKTLIDLAYYYGYTQEEISQSLGIPLGTVKTRLRAAIQELRKRMNEQT